MASGPTLEALLRLRDELSPALSNAEKAAASFGSKWSEGQQRAAMAMSGVHDEALRMNKALDETKTSTGGVAGMMTNFGTSALATLGPLALLTAGAMALWAGLKAIPATLLEWTGAALKTADTLSNLSASTGLSAEALQKMERIGGPVGVSMETVARSAVKLQQRITLVPKAFDEFGLSVDRLKGLDPEQAFEEVVNAIGKLPSRSEQAAASMKLLGDKSSEMLRIIQEGIKPVEDFGEMTGKQVGDLDSLGDATGEAEKAWKNLTMQLAATIAQSPEILAAVKEIAAGIGGMAAIVRDNGPAVVSFFSDVFVIARKLVPQIDQVRDALRMLAADPAIKTPVWDPKKIVPPSMDAEFAKLAANAERYGQEAEAAQVKATAASDKHAAAVKKNAEDFETMRFKAANDEVQQFAKDSKTLIDAGRERSMQIAQDYLDSIKEQEEGDKDRTAFLQKQLEKSTQDYAKYIENVEAASKDTLSMFLDLAHGIGGAVGEMASAYESGAAAAEKMNKVINNPEATSGQKNAAMAIGAIGTAITAYKSGVLGGAAAGAAFGASFGPWGAAIGAAGGALMGLIGKLNLFGNKAIMETNRARDGFFAAQGGFEAFSKKMAAVSTEDWAKKIFDAKTVDEFNALVKEAQGLLEMQGQAQEDVNAAVEKYGFTVDELGPKWAQQELDKKAADLLKDYKLLSAAGIDHNAILERMGPAFTEYVDAAVSSGTSIPMAMKATIDEMFKAGTLIHANGEAFTQAEYDGLSFSQTMTEQFTTLIEKIDQMVSALLGIPSNVNTTVTTTHEDRYPGQHGDPGNQDVPQYALGTPYVPRTGLAVVHQGEAIIPAAQNSRSGGSTSNADVVAAVEALSRNITTVLPKAILHAVQTA